MNTINDNWYESFFHGINCELWLNAVPQSWTDLEIDFLVAQLKLQTPSAILDVPCGFGRHTVALAEKGYSVTAVDISETFIDILKRQVASAGLTVNVICSDILKCELPAKYDAAICLGNSFGYFNYEGMMIFLRKISTALHSGARFIINTGMLAESIFPDFLAGKTFNVKDIKMEISNAYNEREGYMHSDIIYEKGGNRELHSFKHYVYTLAEVTRMIAGCGFRVDNVYSSPSGTQFRLRDPQAYIVAVKE